MNKIEQLIWDAWTMNDADKGEAAAREAISIAGDLLAALQLAWKYYNDPTYQDDLAEIAFATDMANAIEKATGEPCEA